MKDLTQELNTKFSAMNFISFLIYKMKLVQIYLLLLSLCYHSIILDDVYRFPPGWPYKSYSKPGNIIIGSLLPFHRKGNNGAVCTEAISSHASVQYSEMLAYTVEQINNDPDVLPWIKLGYFILDTCGWDRVALAQTLRFLHPNTELAFNSTTAPVLAVLGASFSTSSVLVASLLASFSITQVSASATSPILSDKNKYPTFFRTVQSDVYQAEAMIDLLLHFNWKYISLVYSEGPYGTGAASRIRTLAAENDICLAVTTQIYEDATSQVFLNVADKLISSPRARVVIVFAEGSIVRQVVDALEIREAFHKFILVLSEAVPLENFADEAKIVLNAFAVDIFTVETPEFHDFYEQLTPNQTQNPWLIEVWEQTYNCRFNSSYVNSCPENITAGSIPDYKRATWGSAHSDAIYAVSHALHDVINATCTPPFSSSADLYECVTREKLVTFMNNVSFMGSDGQVRFDENGDVHGKYIIHQLQKIGEDFKVITVAMWDRDGGDLTMVGNVTWDAFNTTEPPKSTCSDPCDDHSVYLYLDMACCWTCQPCRPKEYLANNKTQCKDCAPNTWPDAITHETCEPIEPFYVDTGSALGITLLCVGFIGSACTVAVMFIFAKYRNRRLVKASSRELCFIILLGLLLSYVNIVSHVMKPSTASCVVSYVLFHVTFTLIYGTLLLKIQRVYRVFTASRRGVGLPRWVGTRSQLVLLSVIISVQVLVILATISVVPPVVLWNMPYPSQKYMELYCDHPLGAKLPPLLVNLALLLVCSVLAFKTRGLPDNFSESRFIFFLVNGGLMLWIVFILMYFIGSLAEQKVTVFAATAFANSTLTLMCLFVPKIYALFYVQEEKMRIVAFSVSNAS